MLLLMGDTHRTPAMPRCHEIRDLLGLTPTAIHNHVHQKGHLALCEVQNKKGKFKHKSCNECVNVLEPGRGMMYAVRNEKEVCYNKHPVTLGGYLDTSASAGRDTGLDRKKDLKRIRRASEHNWSSSEVYPRVT
jgi:hypothetical protein